MVIVNLTCLMEESVPLCHQYWPDTDREFYHIYEVSLSDVCVVFVSAYRSFVSHESIAVYRSKSLNLSHESIAVYRSKSLNLVFVSSSSSMLCSSAGCHTFFKSNALFYWSVTCK